MCVCIYNNDNNVSVKPVILSVNGSLKERDFKACRYELGKIK